jgi:hypothetical protein
MADNTRIDVVDLSHKVAQSLVDVADMFGLNDDDRDPDGFPGTRISFLVNNFGPMINLAAHGPQCGYATDTARATEHEEEEIPPSSGLGMAGMS